MKSKPPIRPLHYRTDVPALIQIWKDVFADELEDPRRQSALADMEDALTTAPPGPTTERHARKGLVPFFGFVWDEDGEIKGGLCLIPESRRRYMLVNMAVARPRALAGPWSTRPLLTSAGAGATFGWMYA